MWMPPRCGDAVGVAERRAAAAWSREPIGAGAFGTANGAVTFELDHAALTPAWVVRDLKGVARFQPSEIALNDIDGSLAGGRLNGELAFRRDAGLSAQGRIALADADAATIVASEKKPSTAC